METASVKAECAVSGPSPDRSNQKIHPRLGTMGFASVFTVWVAENCSSSRSETMAKIEYRRLAATCIRLAEQTTDPKTAKALRELAEEYQTKANSIEKAEKRG
jgi:hypothetical protein